MDDNTKVEAAPAIPPGTPSRQELEKKLAAKPDWQEEKELKKQLNYYKEKDRWDAKNLGQQLKQQEEDAKFNALPRWKQEQLARKGAAAKSPSPLQHESPLADEPPPPPPPPAEIEDIPPPPPLEAEDFPPPPPPPLELEASEPSVASDLFDTSKPVESTELQLAPQPPPVDPNLTLFFATDHNSGGFNSPFQLYYQGQSYYPINIIFTITRCCC